MKYRIMYLRKSRQDNESETVEEVLHKHEQLLQEFSAKTYGEKIPETRIYREVVSGETIEDRPEVKKVLKIIEDPNCEGVLVVEPSRLTRGDLMDCGTIVHAFRYSETLVVTPMKTYNLIDKFDRKFFEGELMRGNDYLEYTKEILARGREQSIHNGNYIASIPPYGYRKVKEGRNQYLVVDPVEAEYVKLAYQMYIEGNGAQTIANKLTELGAKTRNGNPFRSTTIRQMLDNEVYLGYMRWKHKAVIKVMEDGKVVKKRPRNKDYELIKGRHEPLVTQEIFDKVKEQKKKATRQKYNTELLNPFAGLIKCKRCGYAIAIRRHRNHDGVTYRKDRYYCRNGVHCDQIGCNSEILDEAIMNTLKAYLEDFKVKITGDNEELFIMQQNILSNLQDQLKKIDTKKESLYSFLEDGIYSKEEFKTRMDLLKKERADLEEKIETARQNMPSLAHYQHQYYSLLQAIEAIENPNVSAKSKNQFLKSIIEVIWYDKKEQDFPNQEPKASITLEVILKNNV